MTDDLIEMDTTALQRQFAEITKKLSTIFKVICINNEHDCEKLK